MAICPMTRTTGCRSKRRQPNSMKGTDKHAAEASTTRPVTGGNRLSGALSRYSYTLLLILVFGTETAVEESS